MPPSLFSVPGPLQYCGFSITRYPSPRSLHTCVLSDAILLPPLAYRILRICTSRSTSCVGRFASIPRTHTLLLYFILHLPSATPHSPQAFCMMRNTEEGEAEVRAEKWLLWIGRSTCVVFHAEEVGEGAGVCLHVFTPTAPH